MLTVKAAADMTGQRESGFMKNRTAEARLVTDVAASTRRRISPGCTKFIFTPGTVLSGGLSPYCSTTRTWTCALPEAAALRH